jgi:hypothetical protein
MKLDPAVTVQLEQGEEPDHDLDPLVAVVDEVA